MEENAVLSSLKYLRKILVEIKYKPTPIRMLAERAEAIIELYQEEKEITLAMLELLASLDVAQEHEIKHSEAISKSIALALEIMKRLGGEPIRAEKGDKFDAKIHKAVGARQVNRPLS